MGEREPKNIFEQILFGQLAINGNVVALAKNVEILNDHVEDILTALSTKSVDLEKPARSEVLVND